MDFLIRVLDKAPARASITFRRTFTDVTRANAVLRVIEWGQAGKKGGDRMYEWRVDIVSDRTDRVIRRFTIKADDWDEAERAVLKLIKPGQYGRLDGWVVNRY